MGKLTDKDKQRAYELYKEGATDVQIAAHFGITPPAVFQWRHACGLPANGKKGQKRMVIETPEAPKMPEEFEAPQPEPAPKPAPAPKDPAAERGEAFLKIAYELGLAFGKGLREGLKE